MPLTNRELDAFDQTRLRIQKEAQEILARAEASHMTYAEIHDTYGIGGVGGTNVGPKLRSPLALSEAIQVVRREINGQPRRVVARPSGAACGWSW